MTAILIIIMLAAVAGMVVCNKKQDKFAMAQPIAFVLLAVVIACGGYLIYNTFSSNEQTELLDRERRFSASRGFVAAEYLNGKGVKSVALLVEPKDAAAETMLKAIKSAGIANVTVIEIEAPASEDMTFFDMVKPEGVQKALEDAADADAIMVVPSLPKNTIKAKQWLANKGKKPVIMLGRPDFPQLDKMIENDVIAGVIAQKSKVDYEADAPRDLKKAFDVRYSFINKENLEANRGMIKD